MRTVSALGVWGQKTKRKKKEKKKMKKKGKKHKTMFMFSCED